jgi:flagellar basal body rod protein FlgB
VKHQMSKRPYECFKCRDNGFPNTMVYLAGKDEQNRTIQLEEDGSKHIHKTKQQQESQEQQSQQPQSQDSPTVVTTTEPTSLKIINAKLDRIISLIESQWQKNQ